MTHSEIRSLLDKVEYKDWHFRLGVKGEVLYLQVVFQAPDNEDPKFIEEHHGRKWMLSRHMTRSEIVFTALEAVLTAEEQKAREQFRYKGQAVFNLHLDIEAWLTLAEDEANDVRPDPPFSPGGRVEGHLPKPPEDTPSRKTKARIIDNRNQTT